MSKALKDTLGCIGGVCDYALGSAAQSSIAAPEQEFSYKFCRRPIGTESRFTCWNGANGVAIFGIELLRNNRLSNADRQTLFTASLKYAGVKLPSVREITRNYDRTRSYRAPGNYQVPASARRASLAPGTRAQRGSGPPNGFVLNSGISLSNHSGAAQPVYTNPATGQWAAPQLTQNGQPNGFWAGGPGDTMPSDGDFAL